MASHRKEVKLGAAQRDVSIHTYMGYLKVLFFFYSW